MRVSMDMLGDLFDAFGGLPGAHYPWEDCHSDLLDFFGGEREKATPHATVRIVQYVDRAGKSDPPCD